MQGVAAADVSACRGLFCGPRAAGLRSCEAMAPPDHEFRGGAPCGASNGQHLAAGVAREGAFSPRGCAMPSARCRGSKPVVHRRGSSPRRLHAQPITWVPAPGRLQVAGTLAGYVGVSPSGEDAQTFPRASRSAPSGRGPGALNVLVVQTLPQLHPAKGVAWRGASLREEFFSATDHGRGQRFDQTRCANYIVTDRRRYECLARHRTA